MQGREQSMRFGGGGCMSPPPPPCGDPPTHTNGEQRRTTNLAYSGAQTMFLASEGRGTEFSPPSSPPL